MIGVYHGEISLFQDDSKLDDISDMDTWLVSLFPILKLGVSGSRQRKEATLGLVGSQKASVYFTLGHLVSF